MTTAPVIALFRSFLAQAPPVQDRPVVRRVELLEADHLVLSYPGSRTRAVDDVSLRVERGEIVALVGVNGAGKTSTVNALLGTVPLDSGVVSIDGREVTTAEPAARLAHFGLLTQEFGRYELTVREAVGLGRSAPATDDEVWEALRSAHLEDLVRSLPAGLDTQLGQQWDGVGLSAGQWQRLALARTHLRGAGIWVLDEPTSVIDAQTEERVFAELQRGRGDRITIVVSHRAWTLRGMDRIYVIEQGRVAQVGTYQELVGQEGCFAELFAGQRT